MAEKIVESLTTFVLVSMWKYISVFKYYTHDGWLVLYGVFKDDQHEPIDLVCPIVYSLYIFTPPSTNTFVSRRETNAWDVEPIAWTTQ